MKNCIIIAFQVSFIDRLNLLAKFSSPRLSIKIPSTLLSFAEEEEEEEEEDTDSFLGGFSSARRRRVGTSSYERQPEGNADTRHPRYRRRASYLESEAASNAEEVCSEFLVHL